MERSTNFALLTDMYVSRKENITMHYMTGYEFKKNE